MPFREDEVECMSVCFEDSLNLKERLESLIQLVGRLIADQESSQNVVKDVWRFTWNKLGAICIFQVKPNVYSIQVGDESVAWRILDRNPWFVKGYTFSVKPWPIYHSLDVIDVNRATFWVQAHGIPRNRCTKKNTRYLGEKLGVVMEIEDPLQDGFMGFLRIKVDLDATKPIVTWVSMPCPIKGTRFIRLKYEGLQDFCPHCGRIGHSNGCPWPRNPSQGHDNFFNEDIRAKAMPKASTLAVNGLSLNKDWCDPRSLPPWAFANAEGLLKASHDLSLIEPTSAFWTATPWDSDQRDNKLRP